MRGSEEDGRGIAHHSIAPYSDDRLGERHHNGHATQQPYLCHDDAHFGRRPICDEQAPWSR